MLVIPLHLNHKELKHSCPEFFSSSWIQWATFIDKNKFNVINQTTVTLIYKDTGTYSPPLS